MTRNEQIALVGAEGLEEDVPSYEAAAKQQRANNDIPHTMGNLKTGQDSTTHLYFNVSISSKSLLVVQAVFSLNSNSSILTTAYCSSLSPRCLASLHSSKILSLGYLSQ